VVVVCGEQALGRRGAGPVRAPLSPASSSNTATAPAASHNAATTAVPLLSGLLTYLERRKQTHTEGRYALPQGAGLRTHAGHWRLPRRDNIPPAFA